MPYDEFLIEQIAADRLPADGNAQGRLAAMGFLTVGRRFLGNPHDIIDDRLDVLCAARWRSPSRVLAATIINTIRFQLAIITALYGVLASSTEPSEPADLMTLADNPRPVVPHVFVRGNPGNVGVPVPRQFLSALTGDDRQPFGAGSGRLDLARAIASPDNPLTARVIVNRVWLYLFDEGLVTTPSDFGLRSQPPSHPELLDYLAASLVEHNWSLKDLIRLIMRSATYQQATVDRPDCRQADPENRLLWRMNRKRLDFEALARRTVGGLGPIGPVDRWPSRRVDRHVAVDAAHDLRPDRSPESAQPVSHVRFRQPRHAQPATLHDHRAATSAAS